jgi:hypothetical protein
MKTKNDLIRDIEAMTNTFKLVIMEDWQIDSMLSQFALTVQLYQNIINNKSDYKLEAKEKALLDKII